MLRPIIIAALIAAPTLAHAEFAARKASEVRSLAPRLTAEPLSVDGVLYKIHKSYMSGLRRCYNRALAQDASLAGKVTLTFTVNPYGRVSGQAIGIAPKVDNCVTAQLGTWRFPTPTARKEATFRMNLVLSQ